ncbi:hypothetical protein ABEB36_011653 [Hypothenemus hampei]|uniref:Peptidase M12B propeptide domain-containing protein n=1 Tax=Hypothenemus hampei TaxID=57062 RepID=A0ABD1E8J7_HYPHA
MLIMFLIIFQISTTTAHVIHGKFTDNIHNYHLLVPHKVTPEGDFSTFELSHYYKYDASQFLKRRKREAHHPDSLHYGVMIDNDLHHLELWPNQDFLHPEAVIEWYDPTLKVKDREVRGIGGKKMCYYMGQVRGKEKSKVALSTCNGLAGFILIDGKMHFIEPVADHTPNSKGHHLHVAYHPSVVEKNENKKYFCGTEDSTEEWNNSIKKYLM